MVLSWLFEPSDKPNLRQIVDKILALFAVYTGATLSFFVKDFLFTAQNIAAHHSLADWLGYWGSWASLAVVALLLRYIVGSAVHLNYAYIPATEQKLDAQTGVITATHTYRSTHVGHLFVDLLFLIAFGILAVFITRTSTDVASFMRASIWFIGTGFVWSAVALTRSKERKIAFTWLTVDGLQIALTLVIHHATPSDLGQAVALGLTYLLFLFADLWLMVRLTSG